MINDFLAFCDRNQQHSFGQNFQDLFALWALNGKTDGYFVEFGALNGRDFSNTYMLEKLGWTGIVAEPHPDFARHVQNNRSCHFSPLCVFDKTGETVVFRKVKGRPALSGIGQTQLNDERAGLRANFEEVPIRTITLNDLLDQYDAPSEIDFVSVDTEGSEMQILRAFDFSQRQVNIWCIEHNHQTRDALGALMIDNGYVRFFEDVSMHDDWWVHTSLRSKVQGCGADFGGRGLETFENQLSQRQQVLQDFRKKYGLA